MLTYNSEILWINLDPDDLQEPPTGNNNKHLIFAFCKEESNSVCYHWPFLNIYIPAYAFLRS